jgi:hypothetical protein
MLTLYALRQEQMMPLTHTWACVYGIPDASGVAGPMSRRQGYPRNGNRITRNLPERDFN